MRLLLCVLLVGAFLLPAPEADACSCASSGIEVWPTNENAAPRNAHIFVRVPGAKQEKIVLRLQGTKDTAGVPSARVDIVSGNVRFVELTPSVTLAKGAQYEVVVGSGDRARVVSKFAVGGKTDIAVPPTPAIDTITFVHEEAVCCTCGSGKPHIRITLAGEYEEPHRNLHGIWTADAKGNVDWNRKPDAYVVSWYGQLTLGDSSICSANNFPIARSGKMTLGIRAVSPSGKQSKGLIRTVKVKAKTKSRFELRKQK